MGRPPTWACWRMVGWCKAQFQRGSLLVGRRSSATPVPTEYRLSYNLPRWSPSSSCSSASATILDVVVAILMWCSSGWCSMPYSCIVPYLSSVVVNACYSMVCRMLFMFSCYHGNSCDDLVYMWMPWSYSYRGTYGYQVGSSLLCLESFLIMWYALFCPWMVILVEW